MKIDLHVHTRTGSDGALPVEEVIREAARRDIGLLSITDHDSIAAQAAAVTLAAEAGIGYITGVELNVTHHTSAGTLSLDFLGYGFDITNPALVHRLEAMAEHRRWRAGQILHNLNAEFARDGLAPLTEADLELIQDRADGTLGRPHIADYLVEKGIVADRQAAFDRYLVKCDVPKYPLGLREASDLVHGAGGRLVLAHPADPHGTSLVRASNDLQEQSRLIEETMLGLIDGVECWHPRHSARATAHYVEFTRRHGLLATGGSDCHQQPIIMGTAGVPDWVASQFPGTGGKVR